MLVNSADSFTFAPMKNVAPALPAEFRIVGTTHYGLEECLAEELRELGIQEVKEHNRAVSFTGTLTELYMVNFSVRTALRFMVELETFEASDADDLYDRISAIRWEEFMNQRHTFAIEARVNDCEWIDNEMFAVQKAKDALVDRFRDLSGTRPSVNRDKPDFLFYLHIFRDKVTVFLDSTGLSLHYRSYRTEANKAPLNEVLAAGLVRLCGWDGRSEFIDPMCGSGTLLIEAAMFAKNIPPGYYKRSYGFMRWKNFDENRWLKVCDKQLAAIKQEWPVISGSDRAMGSVRVARANIERAGFKEHIRVTCNDIGEKHPLTASGVVLLNPPYGERLNEDDIPGLYKHIGNCFKKNFIGFDCWIFTSSPDGADAVGLSAKRRIKLFNGALECRLLKYPVYAGTKKRSGLSENENDG